MISISPDRPLTARATSSEVRALSQFTHACTKFTQDDLAREYRLEMTAAPRRSMVNKPYFVDTHNGIPTTGSSTNRGEEHLALALFNHYRLPQAGLILPNGEELHILDYQLPLKAKQSDSGVGKVDLFGITSSGHAAVIELKAAGSSEAPLRPLIEGLAYTAIIQANIATLKREAYQHFGKRITTDIPTLIVMAPDEYWSPYRSHPLTRGWEQKLQGVANHIQQGMGVRVQFVALADVSFTYGLAGTRPRLIKAITCTAALQESV